MEVEQFVSWIIHDVLTCYRRVLDLRSQRTLPCWFLNIYCSFWIVFCFLPLPFPLPTLCLTNDKFANVPLAFFTWPSNSSYFLDSMLCPMDIAGLFWNRHSAFSLRSQTCTLQTDVPAEGGCFPSLLLHRSLLFYRQGCTRLQSILPEAGLGTLTRPGCGESNHQLMNGEKWWEVVTFSTNCTEDKVCPLI